MTMRDFTTTALLADVRRRAWIPSSDADFTDAVLLSIGDEVIEEFIAPAVIKCHEEYFVTTADIPVVAGQQEYNMPARGYGPQRDVKWIDPSGNGIPMAQLSVEDRDLFAGSALTLGAAPAFCIQNDRIVLIPMPTSSTGTIRVRYFRRPNRLVLPAACEKVVSSAQVSSTSATVIVTSDVLLSGAGSIIADAIRGTPEFRAVKDSGNLSWASSLNRVLLMAGTVGIDPLAAGDYLALEGESPIPQIPHPFFQALSTGIAGRALEMRGDNNGMMRLYGRMGQAMEAASGLITPRVHGATKHTVNWRSPLRSATQAWRSRGFR